MTGGEQDQLIVSSVFGFVGDFLDSEGWFDAGRPHAPLSLVAAFPDGDDDPLPNTLAVTFDNAFGDSLELGSRAESYEMEFYLDLFADTESLAVRVMGDLYDHVKNSGRIPVFDPHDSGGQPFMWVEVDLDSMSNRKARPTQPWQRHWRVVEFVVLADRWHG